jgi:pimeloyl-ACP methyl ester carboxylesterase
MPDGEFETITRADGIRLAYQRFEGVGPTLVWLPGFNSDMWGTKAQALADWAKARGQSMLRLDYSGTGRSEGRFEDGAVGIWLADALAVIDAKSDGPLVLVGSSMGAWIALLIAQARPERVKALLLIAPAPDFTERLMWPSFSAEPRRRIMEDGVWPMPSEYGPPIPVTRALIEDGRRHLLLDGPIVFAGPVRILHGEKDADVPWSHALALAGALWTGDLTIRKIPGGDHRLSRPEDIALLLETAAALARQISPD